MYKVCRVRLFSFPFDALAGVLFSGTVRKSFSRLFVQRGRVLRSVRAKAARTSQSHPRVEYICLMCEREPLYCALNGTRNAPFNKQSIKCEILERSECANAIFEPFSHTQTSASSAFSRVGTVDKDVDVQSPSPPTRTTSKVSHFANSVELSASELSKMRHEQKADSEQAANGSDESTYAAIGQLERLIRTHPIWFLPEIGRTGVIHLLQVIKINYAHRCALMMFANQFIGLSRAQGKEVGCFIVRQSSKPQTMAMSVRLPEGKGPHIEHYLIETAPGGKFHLEGTNRSRVAQLGVNGPLAGCPRGRNVLLRQLRSIHSA